MDKKLKAKWVRALRSGRYKQCQSTLREDAKTRQGERFCCLGVLCEVTGARRARISGYWLGKRRAVQSLPYGTKLFNMIGQTNQNTLVTMNDGDGVSKPRSFRSIAQWIKRNL